MDEGYRGAAHAATARDNGGGAARLQRPRRDRGSAQLDERFRIVEQRDEIGRTSTGQRHERGSQGRHGEHARGEPLRRAGQGPERSVRDRAQVVDVAAAPHVLDVGGCPADEHGIARHACPAPRVRDDGVAAIELCMGALELDTCRVEPSLSIETPQPVGVAGAHCAPELELLVAPDVLVVDGAPVVVASPVVVALPVDVLDVLDDSISPSSSGGSPGSKSRFPPTS
jgi:hypothetical protein